VLELELIEPCLYLREGGAGALRALADALEARLARAAAAARAVTAARVEARGRWLAAP
jgi:hypothetical protein